MALRLDFRKRKGLEKLLSVHETKDQDSLGFYKIQILDEAFKKEIEKDLLSPLKQFEIKEKCLFDDKNYLRASALRLVFFKCEGTYK